MVPGDDRNTSSAPDETDENHATEFDIDDDEDQRFAVSVPFDDIQGRPRQFVSRYTAYDYIQAWAKTEGFAIKMGRTRKRNDKITVYSQELNCVCGGTKDNSTLLLSLSKRKGRSKHVACKWHCNVVEEDRIWRGYMVGPSSRVHNHPRSFGATYPVHRRKERQAIPGVQQRVLSDARVKTITRKETQVAVSRQYPGLQINLKDIFNIQAKEQVKVDDGLPTIQAMVRSMGDAFQFHYSTDTSDRLVNLVFCEKASLELLRRWSYTIVLDATYKTNKFNMYLVDIVGTTSTGRSFIIA